MKGYKTIKNYPEWTVPKCICYVGHFTSDCPYAQPEDEEYLKEKVYLSHESPTEDSSRPDRLVAQSNTNQSGIEGVQSDSNSN